MNKRSHVSHFVMSTQKLTAASTTWKINGHDIYANDVWNTCIASARYTKRSRSNVTSM